MRFKGLQKLTLLDYPGMVACTLFTGGCNFRCPFCQNASLVLPDHRSEDIPEEEVYDFLKKRVGILDGVALTGGEPLLEPDIKDFLRAVKAMGYRIKLDTNGTSPDLLAEIISEGLVDRVAMDIKSSPANYARVTGVPRPPMERIEKSMKILMEGTLPFEFRTTVVRGLHDEEDLLSLAKWIAGDEEYYLQQYRDSGDLIAPDGLSAYSDEEMLHFASLMKPYVPCAQARGITNTI